MLLNVKLFKNILLVLLSVVFTLFTFRPLLQGQLLGDPFDARLHIILHEHWWKWLNGEVSFRDPQFFYPFNKDLGYSDVFLIQGILYSILRFFSIEIAWSWSITNLIIVLIGNIGWVLFAKKYLSNLFVQILFLFTVVSSISFVNYSTLNSNSGAYTFISWLSYFYINISKEKNINKKNYKYFLFLVLFLIYALSCWYAAFFLFFIIFFKKFFDLIFLKEYKSIDLNKINFKALTLMSPFIAFFTWLFVYIYLSVANQPFRNVQELLGGSPRLSLIANGGNIGESNLKGAVFGPLYKFLNLDFNRENGFGVGLFLFVIFVILGIQYLFKNSFKYSKISWFIAILIPYFLFLNINNNFSIFAILFEYIPGFNSIRYPSRYVIFIGYFMIFTTFYLIDKKINKSTKISTRIILLSISLLIATDQIRAPFKGWDSELLYNKELFSQADQIKANCDYFYYDYPGGWWYDQIEAMTFSMFIGIPTVNGYSGAFPPGYPTEPFYSEKMPYQIFNWISQIEGNKVGCFVTGRSPIAVISQNLLSVDLVGFTNVETNNSDFWNWAVTKNPYFYVVNFTNKDLLVNFEIKSSSCNTNSKILFKDSNDKKILESEISTVSKNIEFNLQFKNEKVKKIDIMSNLKPCKFENDPRELYFEVKNLKYQVVN